MREVFLNPADVGGRYSALSYVGLVPAALMGLDLRALLAPRRRWPRTRAAPVDDNPGLWLGATLGALAKAGRDKLTLVIEPGVARLGAWIEQLVAESTGKHGVGIVPVDRRTAWRAGCIRQRPRFRAHLDRAPTPPGSRRPTPRSTRSLRPVIR